MKPPIIIVGAARSGTNMLRDMLVTLPQFTTWPCDEINYIWRHGNRDHPHEEFTRDMATVAVKRYIRRAVKAVNGRALQASVVEKTCATSLRCGFVDEVFPDAKFIHIYRDGRAVAASAALRWNAGLEPIYLLRKARYVPPGDFLFYAQRYLASRIYRLRTGKKRLSTWGPKFAGMEQVFQQHELSVACALQWARCVESANAQLGELAPGRVYAVCYETFISHPEKELAKLLRFLGVSLDKATIERLANSVSPASLGKWEKQLTAGQLAEIERLVGDTLRSTGFMGSGKANGKSK